MNRNFKTVNNMTSTINVLSYSQSYQIKSPECSYYLLFGWDNVDCDVTGMQDAKFKKIIA